MPHSVSDSVMMMMVGLGNATTYIHTFMSIIQEYLLTQLMVQSSTTAKALRSRDCKLERDSDN